MRGAVLACWLAACACATARPAPGPSLPGAAPGPRLAPPSDWDRAFAQLVARCPSPEQGPGLQREAVFELGVVVASVAAGGYALAHRQMDLTTGLATAVGVAAVAGELASLFGFVRDRLAAQRAFERQQDDWLRAWEAADPAGRRALLAEVASSCGEQGELAEDERALGPLR